MTPRTAVLTALACGVFAVVLFRPVRDVDMFWQVRHGQVMLETGRLVTADPFTATHPGEPTPTIYWLSQLLYAGLHRAGGWELLHRLDAALFALALWLAAVAGRTPRGNVVAAAGAFGLAFLVALPHHGLRPQTFGLLGFAAVVALSRSGFGAGPKTLATLAVCVLWQNLHPSASAGAIYLGAVAAGGLARWLMTRGDRFPWAAVLPAVAAAVSVFLTPDGVDILRLSAENAAVARAIGVEEWLPIWDPATWPASRMVWVGALATAALAVAARRTVGWEDLAVAVVLTVAAALVYRMSLFWAVAMVPVWARWAEAVLPASEEAAAEPRVPRAVGLAAVLAAGLVPAVARPPVLAEELPFAGLERVRELRLSGVVYNYREWGGPLILGAPDCRVTIDGRLYLFPLTDWDEYVRVARGEVPVEAVEARHRPAAFFLRPSYHAAFVDQLRASGRWRQEFADESAVLFVRQTDRADAAGRHD